MKAVAYFSHKWEDKEEILFFPSSLSTFLEEYPGPNLYVSTDWSLFLLLLLLSRHIYLSTM